jgi:cyclase
MLKRRIIPIELLAGGRLVKTRGFAVPRDVGDPVTSSKVYSDQDADELLLLRVDRDKTSIEPLVTVLASIAARCYVPLAAGGGIASLDDAARLFEAGADKVVINSNAYQDSSTITRIGELYGRQAVIVGIDVRLESGAYALYSNCGRRPEPIALEEHIATVVEAGAGELMIQAIDRDGMMTGYDLDLLRRVVAISAVPVIAAAGAGHFIHLKEAFDAGVDAAACGSLFNFGDNSPLRAKAFLKNYGIPLKKI